MPTHIVMDHTGHSRHTFELMGIPEDAIVLADLEKHFRQCTGPGRVAYTKLPGLGFAPDGTGQVVRSEPIVEDTTFRVLPLEAG